MEEYRVDFDFENGEPVEHSAAVNMALDEHILGRAADEGVPYLRVYGFEEPAFIPSRRTSTDDISGALGNGYDFTRRNTNGSTIPCLDNGVAYSVAYPTEDFPDRVFREKVAPSLVEALESAGIDSEELSVGEKHDAIRYGGRSTLGEAAPGKTIAGSSLWRKGGSVLSHGVIAVKPWDSELLAENMELRPGEESFVEELPSVQAVGEYDEEKFAYALIDGFTGGEYMAVDLGREDVEDLLEEKYSNSEWTLKDGLQEGRGHCFVEEEDGRFY
ncbi:MAG: biotin/lipoate A/B protein ligase family protein [Candidatus Nanosalina sp.]